MGHIVLFQLTFTFIYSTFNNNFSVSAKYVVSKHTLSECLTNIKKPAYFTIQLILQFSLFLLLFMGPIALFGTIHASYYTISANFFFYLQYFQ